MSALDKVIAAVTPIASEEQRAEARTRAFAAAEPGDWLSLILDHHIELEEALAVVEEAVDLEERNDAFKEFAILLTGHAIAEEGVIYPALSMDASAGHADKGYSEQAVVKLQMAALERLDPLSEDFEDKLEEVKTALQQHMYEEEGGWFLDLRLKATAEDQATLTARYAEEFDRYVGDAGPLVDEEEDED